MFQFSSTVSAEIFLTTAAYFRTYLEKIDVGLTWKEEIKVS